MAHEIASYYENRDYVILVVLKGAVPFYSAIEKYLTDVYKYGLFNNKIRVEYVKCSSYVDDKSVGKVKNILFYF